MLLADIALGKIDVIVVYKVDRLTRSLADFAKIVEVLDARGASFVSVTQSFNTTSSMGRLTLNVLLSFAQFEREVTGERIRDKIAASKAKGMWMGGPPPLGYDVQDRRLVVNDPEADTVRHIFKRYLDTGSIPALAIELELDGVRSKPRTSRHGRAYGSARIARGALYTLLKNRLYVGDVTHKGQIYKGQHDAIIDRDVFEAAQRQLDENRVERHLGNGSPHPSLLAGLLWDTHGRRMSPKHATKQSRRYRYYVSRTDDAEACVHPIWRISAPDIEGRVIEGLVQQLRATVSSRISDGVHDAEAIERMRGNAADVIEQLRSGIGRTQRKLVSETIERIELHSDRIVAIARLAHVDPLLDVAVTATLPVDSIRSGKQLKLVIRATSDEQGAHRNPALIKLVTQAAAAREVLANCRSTDFDHIAAAMGYGREHAADLIRIGYLAPDITAAILDGRQPPELTRTKLTRTAGLPLCWNAQRTALGFV